MKALVAAALVGTARQTSVPATASAVDPLIAALPEGSAERRLLLTAGAAAVHRQAGYLPVQQALPAPSEPDPLGPPSARAATLLASIIDGPREALLLEACMLLARAGRRLPASLLPRLLDTKTPEVRAAFLPVLGARARWLAGFNPAWRWVLESDIILKTALPDDAEAIWQEGTPPRRHALLALARTVEPERARAWLDATWKAERAEQRADFLETLAANLSLDDEPFLEAALDDRSERVRTRAGSLLSTLPESAFAARMTAHAPSLLDYRAPSLLDYRAPGLIKHRSGLIIPHRPQEIDKAWQRDLSIAKLPSPIGEADRAEYLTQTIALIPLTHWTRLFGRYPETLVVAAESEPDVVIGWSRAALNQRDAAWAAPLWGWWCEREEQNTQQSQPVRSEMLQGLLPVLPPAQAEQLLALQVARHGDSLNAVPWTAVLHSLPRPWGVELSTVCLAALRRFLAGLQPNTYPHYTFWYQNLQIIAAGIAPASLSEALRPFDMPAPIEHKAGQPRQAAWQTELWRQGLQAFGETIELRHRLHRELSA